MVETHRNYLIDPANGLKAAGFQNIRLDDIDLARLTLDEYGAEALADETMEVDDATQWRADWPRAHTDDVEQIVIGILCCNDPWETVFDHTIPSQEANEAFSQVLGKLEEVYQ